MQTNRLHILLLVLFLSLFSLKAISQENTTNIDPLLQTKDSIAIDNSVRILNDSIVTIENDSITPITKKEGLSSIVEHSAKGHMLSDIVNNKLFLYDGAHVIYDGNDITAGEIVVDNTNNTVVARGIPDEDGEYSQLPVFKSAGNESTQDSLIFNHKTKKAIIYGVETVQDGINTLGEKTKRVNDSTIFIKNIIFTTSDPRNPDYYLKTTKAKVVPGKKIITGLTNLVIADVPTPAFFPFAYFPLTKEKTSGIIFPTYGESNNQGFFLQNGGYYLALNDYFDLKITGDIYSNGSWGINTASNYRVKYKFSGNFSFNYDNLINSIEGFDDHSIAKNFNIRWSHGQDSKASPNSRFSASVNLGSSQYFRQSTNESNVGQGLTNTLSSSISYFKKFVDTPFSLTASANHRQTITADTDSNAVFLTLPSLQLSMDRQYPFAPKNGTSKNAFQKIGLTYSLKAENRIQTTEEELFSGNAFDDAKNGAQHNVSLSTNMKVLKYFSLSPSMSYREVWYSEGIHKEFVADDDPDNKNGGDVIEETISGFNAFRTYSASTSIGTTLYGMFKLKNSKLKAIRHTMRPSISYSYTPDFGFYSEQVQNGAESTNNLNPYTRFDGGIYGAPSSGVSNALSFSLANTLEGKVANKEDPEGEDKKINILNSLNLSTGYDFTRESFKLSTVGLSAGTTIFKKMNLNFNATLDPYALALNENGSYGRIDALSYKNGGALFRMTNARFTTGYSFSNKTFTKEGEEETKDEDQQTPHDQDMFGADRPNTNDFAVDPEDERNNKKKKKATLPEYISAMPWNLRLSLSTGYSNNTGEKKISSNSLTLSGDIELSPGWKVSGSSGYDFVNKGLTYTNLAFKRDLGSWNMSFNWVPLGNFTSYYFFIGVTSSVLSDLKWDKRKVNTDF